MKTVKRRDNVWSQRLWWHGEAEITADGDNAAGRFAAEDHEASIVAYYGEPVLRTLKPGRNLLSRGEFFALARYLYDGQDATFRRAIRDGVLDLGNGCSVVRVALEVA